MLYIKRNLFLPAIVFIFSITSSPAQEKLLSGTITDKSSNRALPYATVVLKNRLTGIAANENGQFDLHVPGDAMNDTLLVSAFGYKRQHIPVKNLPAPLIISLQPHSTEIEEVVVTPQPPEYYIRQAMRRVHTNYPDHPFETVAFYRERVKENDAFVQCDEAVFLTYCPDYLDTTKNQDRVLLYRQPNEISKIRFMNEDKQTRKARKKGRELPTADTSKKEKVKVASSFGGPQGVLRSSKPGKGWTFLDTNKLRSFNYSFGGNTFYHDNEVMIIEYASRGKVDHIRDKGRLFITRENFAIVRIEDEGTFVIPVVVRPILFTLGIGVTNPRFTRTVEFQPARGKWFPQKVLFNIHLDATKRYLFSPNEHSSFHIDQVYVVNELRTENVTPVEPENKYDPSKPVKEQVKPDGTHTWENVNVMRR